jgi:hypothetical protein
MGIQVEFNPDLALRDIAELKAGRRKIEECIPDPLEKGKIYEFLKKGQRLYFFSDDEFWRKGEVSLAQAYGDGRCSRPLASIKFLEVTHFLDNGEVWSKGKYQVMDIFDINDPAIHFEVTKRI